MAIQFTCPSCHQLVTVSEQHAGGQVFCPTCRAQLTVPQGGGQSQMLQGGVVGPQAPAPSQPAPAPSYGAAPAGGPGVVVAAPKRSGMAITSLVLSILSWIICCIGPLLSLPGFILGLVARGKIKRSRGMLTGGGMATAGWIISLLNLLLVVGTVITCASVPLLRNMIVSGYRLGMLNQACLQYTMSNGQMPPDLQTLVDQGLLTDSDQLICPASGEPYVYTAANMSRSDLHRGVVIAYSTFKVPDDKRLVLTWGGQVTTMPVAMLKSQLRSQGVPEDLIP
ncbi:MAG: DUF4190 domain-containing protein [Planctomycetes bacterium]|nr:DUF4190 domain-containing protein [Planctomycetota bacterium]